MNTENKEEVKAANEKMFAMVEQFASGLGLKLKKCSATYGMGELKFSIKLVDPNPSAEVAKKKFAYLEFKFHDVVKALQGREYLIIDVTPRGGYLVKRMDDLQGPTYKLKEMAVLTLVRHEEPKA